MNKKKTLKQIASSPSYNINNAIMQFRSKNLISIFVEGKKDQILFKTTFPNDNIAFPVCDGKGNVIDALNCLNKMNKDILGIYFIVDVDFDFILGKIIDDPKLIYSFFCNSKRELYFNDLENFLIYNRDSNSLNKIVLNLEPTYEFDLNLIQDKLELFSRILGSYRAADEKLNGEKSILDGIDLFEFISFPNKEDWQMNFNEDALRNRLETSSPRKLDIEDLFSEAKKLNESCKYGELSKGHDLSKLLKIFLENNTKGHLIKRNWKTADDIEAMLRMSMDTNSFLQTNVGKKIKNILKVVAKS